jgi:hypothetical protein
LADIDRSCLSIGALHFANKRKLSRCRRGGTAAAMALERDAGRRNISI